MKGLYIHIPFCKHICTYCDFPKMIAKEEVHKIYLKHLIQELSTYKEELTDVDTIYIGGGTPNVLLKENLEFLLRALNPYLKHSRESTIEINAELFTEEQAQLFSKYNINRVSIGVQTLNPHLISLIGRHHTYEDVCHCISLLKKYHIDNINIDMMLGLPTQTMEDLRKDLEQILPLNLSHLSYYSLILEEKTILMHQIKHHQIELPDDDLAADMMEECTHFLKMNGFYHYEISNFAKRGYESAHNLKYWSEEEYVGIGAGAAGFLHGIRYTNHSVLKEYYQHPIQTTEVISKDEMKREYMMLGLRKCEGISILDYTNRFSSHPLSDFKLEKYIHQGFIEEINGFLRIKEDKRLLSNLVFEEFVR